MYLFGSRARGTARPDSDYDILLVVDPQFTLRDKDHLYDGVMDALLETGQLISLKIYKQPFFIKLWRMGAPLMANLKKDGVQIG